MSGTIQVVCLLCVAITVTLSAAEHSETVVQKSRLLLEYDWPEPSKNLRRLPHPKSCHHFYVIKHDGSHTIKKCHKNHVFDYRSLRCAKETHARCWKDIVTKGNLKKVKRQFLCPFPWGLYPDTEDCSQFYDCLGGKAFPRKCPDSTLFDKVEKTCVQSNLALCAKHSDIEDIRRNFYEHHRDRNNGHRRDRNSDHDKERNGDQVRGEDNSRGRKKTEEFSASTKSAGNADDFSKIERLRPQTTEFYEFMTSLPENASTERKIVTSFGRYKSTRKFVTDSDESSSEERNSSEEKYIKRTTKSKNKLRTSTFKPTAIKSKSTTASRTISDESSSEEIDSLEEKGNRFSTKSKIKSTTSRVSKANTVDKNIVSEIMPSTSVVFTKKEHETSSVNTDASRGISLQISTTVKPSLNPEHDPKSSVIARSSESISTAGYKTDDSTDHNLERTSEHTVITSAKSLPPSEHTVIISESLPPSEHTVITSADSLPPSERPSPGSDSTESTDPKSTNTVASDIICPESDGQFPHPSDQHKFIVCVGGNLTVMDCPENLVYSSQKASCDYSFKEMKF